jgi:two-component system, NtrC family, sensor histidine kinase HydH
MQINGALAAFTANPIETLAQVQSVHHSATHAPQVSSLTMAYLVGTFIILVLLIGGFMLLTRKIMREGSSNQGQTFSDSPPGTENPSAFMAASMHGVIEKLRAQEKELARLHLLAQERAQESERLTEEVTRNMPTGLLLVNATGAIGSANPAAEEALGVHALRYRSYREVLGPDSDLSQMLAACLHEGKTFHRGEIEHLTRDGEVRHLGVTISPIYRHVRTLVRAASGESAAAPEMKISGALCLMSDLTEITALQKQIRWKENLAALGEMSAGIAHEFKNALATISGYAQMICSEAKTGDTHDSAERILDQTRSLTHVVTEFLRFAKPLEICYETVPMQTVVERVAADLRDIFPQCEISCDGAFVDLPGDEALLRQALLNLARNAAESLGAGKPVRVSISGTMEELAGRKWQRICVADNGPGIPEQDLPKIFLPFYTTKSEGTGLGLAVVQKVALQHGGSIEARNRQGGGAEFMLWLPLRQEPSPSLFPSQAARI